MNFKGKKKAFVSFLLAECSFLFSFSWFCWRTLFPETTKQKTTFVLFFPFWIPWKLHQMDSIPIQPKVRAFYVLSEKEIKNNFSSFLDLNFITVSAFHVLWFSWFVLFYSNMESAESHKSSSFQCVWYSSCHLSHINEANFNIKFHTLHIFIVVMNRREETNQFSAMARLCRPYGFTTSCGKSCGLLPPRT